MSCFENINIPPCIWFQADNKRNAVASIGAGSLVRSQNDKQMMTNFLWWIIHWPCYLFSVLYRMVDYYRCRIRLPRATPCCSSCLRNLRHLLVIDGEYSIKCSGKNISKHFVYYNCSFNPSLPFLMLQLLRDSMHSAIKFEWTLLLFLIRYISIIYIVHLTSLHFL